MIEQEEIKKLGLEAMEVNIKMNLKFNGGQNNEFAGTKLFTHHLKWIKNSKKTR